MDWPSLWIGAVVGGTVGVVMQNIMYPILERQWSRRRRIRKYDEANLAWRQVERLHPRLVLVQSGWDANDCFTKGSVVMRLEGSFALSDAKLREMRDSHAAEWIDRGFVNGEQVGISAISISRTSDDPNLEREGRAHELLIRAHRYHFFDFLATHSLRITGSETERKLLDDHVGEPSLDHPTKGFPTPCSVGISVFCEDGGTLLMTRRASGKATGYWEAGKVFNAVGENAAARDFSSANQRAHESHPEIVAQRGLYEELGLYAQQVSDGTIAIHSFAWASDLLDFKFFGFFKTSLSYAEVSDRWKSAPDRLEASGVDLISWRVDSREDCRELIAAMKSESNQWSPEAIFSTLRSLLALRKVSAADLRAFVR